MIYSQFSFFNIVYSFLCCWLWKVVVSLRCQKETRSPAGKR
nr:MAG TPA: hypothetical protein [Caudoviricetes sp.]